MSHQQNLGQGNSHSQFTHQAAKRKRSPHNYLSKYKAQRKGCNHKNYGTANGCRGCIYYLNIDCEENNYDASVVSWNLPRKNAYIHMFCSFSLKSS